MTTTTTSPEAEAALLYVRRASGRARPEGRCDSAHRWYPAGIDDTPDVLAKRSPSRAWPWSYYKACFTLRHCAAIYGADAKIVRQMCALVGY